MTKFDKTSFAVIRRDFDAAVKEMCEKHNITLQLGSIKFTDVTFDAKLSAKINNPELLAEKDKKDFEWYAPMFGLKAEDFGSVFNNGGRQFKVTGIAPKNRRYPLIAKCLQDGKSYKFPERVLKLVGAL